MKDCEISTKILTRNQTLIASRAICGFKTSRPETKSEAAFISFYEAFPSLLDRKLSALLEQDNREVLFSIEAIEPSSNQSGFPCSGSRVVDFLGDVG